MHCSLVRTDVPSSMLGEIANIGIRRDMKEIWRTLHAYFFPKGKKKVLFFKSQLIDGQFIFACFDFSRFVDNLCNISEWMGSSYYLG